MDKAMKTEMKLLEDQWRDGGTRFRSWNGRI